MNFLPAFLLPLGVLLTLTARSQPNTYSYASYGSRLTQCQVITDKYNRVATKCINFRNDNTTLETIRLGSGFFADSVWHDGVVDLDGTGKPFTCKISYNLNPVEILCYLEAEKKQVSITPASFIINGTRFISYTAPAFGKNHRKYFTVLADGETRLLQHYSVKPESPPFELKTFYSSWFMPVNTYYIQQGSNPPVEVQLTKRSISRALGQPVAEGTAKEARKTLTPDEAVAFLKGMMVVK